MRHLGLAIVCVLVAVSVARGEQPGSSKEISLERENLERAGIKKFYGKDLSTLVAGLVNDSHYQRLRQVARERHIRLDTKKAWGADFAGRYKAVFVPAFDTEGRERGFFVSNGQTWTLSLAFASEGTKFYESFRTKTDADGNVVVEAVPLSGGSDTHLALGMDGSACSYVSNFGMRWFCYDCDFTPYGCTNPFAYYYTKVYRWGYSYPEGPSWWACYLGNLHVCPLHEASGSPYFSDLCGIPPSHPEG
jgi:hypothetical protein